MGMTIDEAIEIINHYLDYPKEKVREALLLSIDTMHKYQKIERIIRNYDAAWEFHTLRGTIDKIREVIEDGDDK